MTFKITNSKNKETLVKAESWLDLLHGLSKDVVKVERIIEADKEYEVEVVARGKCMMCGKELTDGLFFCRECEAKQVADKE